MNTNVILSNLLLKSSDYQCFGDINRKISFISYDSRKIGENSCFVAIKGEKFDGHNYIANAIDLGAKVIICENLPTKYNDIKNYITFIVCKSSRQMLAEISNAYYGYPANNMKMIAVTGTNGKTTSTFLFKSILEQANFKCGIIGTTGIFIDKEEIPATHTTPESLELFEVLSKMKNTGVEYVIMEVSSHSLIQKRVFGINFELAVFTNLTHEHLDYHNTIENYAEAKKILFSNLKENSYAVINSNSDWAEFMVKNIKCMNIIRVTNKSEGNSFIIKNEKIDLDGISYKLENDKYSLNIKSKLTGRFNIENSSLVAASCIYLGINLKDIELGLEKSKGAPGRMQKYTLKNGAIALIDYAHTPDALEKALNSCKEITLKNNQNNNSKLICVFGCGGDRDKTKRPEMGAISTKIADITIVTSDNPRTESPKDIINDILKGISKESNYYVIEDRREAIKYAKEISNNSDIILIAGKGHENYQIIGTQKYHFDDYEEISKID